MARLSIAPAARADIRTIRVYSKSEFGAKTARAYLDGLRGQFAAALARPLTGRAEPDLGKSMRSTGFRSHRIYYRVSDDGVLVVRILHQAQDVGLAFRTAQ